MQLYELIFGTVHGVSISFTHHKLTELVRKVTNQLRLSQRHLEARRQIVATVSYLCSDDASREVA